MTRKIPASSPIAPATTPAIPSARPPTVLKLTASPSVALIAFLALALVASPLLCGKLILWLFAIQGLMVVASLVSFYSNMVIANVRYGGKKNFNWEAPLTDLVWITSIISIIVCFFASKFLLGDFEGRKRPAA